MGLSALCRVCACVCVCRVCAAACTPVQAASGGSMMMMGMFEIVSAHGTRHTHARTPGVHCRRVHHGHGAPCVWWCGSRVVCVRPCAFSISSTARAHHSQHTHTRTQHARTTAQGTGVWFNSEATFYPSNVASTEIIDRKTPNSEVRWCCVCAVACVEWGGCHAVDL